MAFSVVNNDAARFVEDLTGVFGPASVPGGWEACGLIIHVDTHELRARAYAVEAEVAATPVGRERGVAFRALAARWFGIPAACALTSCVIYVRPDQAPSPVHGTFAISGHGGGE